MSLLFESAVSEVTSDELKLFSPPDSNTDIESKGEHADIPVSVIMEYAEGRDSLLIEEGDDSGGYRIPLHEKDTANLTQEYVIYKNHDTHGKIVKFDGDTPFSSFLNLEELAESKLSDRLRFWHPDFVPKEYPAYYDTEIDEREQPTKSIESDEFFDSLLSHLKKEKEKQREINSSAVYDADFDFESLYHDSDSEIGVIPEASSRGFRDGLFWIGVEYGVDRNEKRDWWGYVQSEFRVFEGNEVLLHTVGGGTDDFPLKAEVEEVDGLNIGLAIDKSQIENISRTENTLTDTSRSFALTLLLNTVPYDREETAVRQVRDDERLSKVLTGNRDLTFGDPSFGSTDLQDAELNQDQQEAVKFSLLADDLFVLHGPPGTGKTRTLIEIVRRHALSGNRVLVSADSNQAVDNLLLGSDERSLHRYGQHGEGEFRVERHNVSSTSNPEIEKYYSQSRSQSGSSNDGSSIGGADVVLATNNSASDLASNFDITVIDEATQSTITSSLIPISKAEKFILAGDHKQLPPFSASEEPPESSFGLSLFEHLYAEGGVYENIGVKLETQYRMHRDIARFSNYEFYGGDLRNGRERETLDGRDTAIEAYNFGGEVGRRGNSYYNSNEADFIAYHLVSQILEESNIDPEDIGVITPYWGQVVEVRNKLRDTGLESIDVDTIDSFQGSEREVILISLVRSNSEGEIGFLGREPDGSRRLNVALTRAKRYCGIVGDLHTFRYSSEDKNNELYDGLYSYLENNRHNLTNEMLEMVVEKRKP